MAEQRMTNAERQGLALAETILNRVFSDETFRKRLAVDPAAALQETFGSEIEAARALRPESAEVSGYVICTVSCGYTCTYSCEGYTSFAR